MTTVADEEAERAAREIARTARRERVPLPRTLWVFAGVVGTICTIFFLRIFTAGAPEPASSSPVTLEGGGFAKGIAIGLAVGFVVGWALARQRASHSSRNRP